MMYKPLKMWKILNFCWKMLLYPWEKSIRFDMVFCIQSAEQDIWVYFSWFIQVLVFFEVLVLSFTTFSYIYFELLQHLSTSSKLVCGTTLWFWTTVTPLQGSFGLCLVCPWFCPGLCLVCVLYHFNQHFGHRSQGFLKWRVGPFVMGYITFWSLWHNIFEAFEAKILPKMEIPKRCSSLCGGHRSQAMKSWLKWYSMLSCKS